MTNFDSAGALLRAWELFAAEIPDGWNRRVVDAIGVVTGLPLPVMNGVWATSADVDVDAVRAVLDSIMKADIPHCLQFPGSHRGLAALAVERDMERGGDMPLMCLFGEPAATPVPALVVRRLSADELMTHADVAARGFEAPVEILESLVAMTARTDGVGMYVGEYNGEPVTTAIGLTVGDSVGVFNVATPREHRGNGYGTAITAQVVRDGYSAGAQCAWLQSSPEGYAVYQRMGFVTVASWQCWIADGTPPSDEPDSSVNIAHAD